MIQEKKGLWATVVFWGALWGLMEATLGWLLHFLPSNVSGLVMFPIGVYFMLQASQVRGKRMDILIAGGVAAAIKLVNLVIPGLPYFKTLNPAVSIFLEALLVFAAISVFDIRKGKQQIPLFSLTAAFGWRVIFLLYLVTFHGITTIPTNFFTYQPLFAIHEPALRFVFLNGLYETLLVGLVLLVALSVKQLRVVSLRVKLPVACTTIGLGLVAQIFL